MSDFCVAGVDLGGTKIYTVLASSRGEVLAEQKIPTEAEKGPQHVIARILESVEQVRKAAFPASRRLRALTLGAPGPLDTSRGIIHFAPKAQFTHRGGPRKTGSRLLDNDANLAAWGALLQAGRGAENMVFTVSTGVGGNDPRKDFTGADAGEIGHMTVLPTGPLPAATGAAWAPAPARLLPGRPGTGGLRRRDLAAAGRPGRSALSRWRRRPKVTRGGCRH